MPHGHVHEPDVSVRSRQVLFALAIALGLVTLVAVVLLRPTGEDRPDISRFGVVAAFYEAHTLQVETGPCPGTPVDAGAVCTIGTFELREGPDDGQVVDLALQEQSGVESGDRVVLSYDPSAPEEFQYQFSDFQRRPPLLALTVLFSLAVIALGRLRGLAALAALGASVIILIQFVLPAILDGRSAVAVAVVGSALLAYVALYASHGLSVLATVALLGTLAALGLTALLAAIFTSVAHFSGLASEEALFLVAADATVDLRGLLLAGMVIGTLGALDDVTVTQASVVFELHATEPTRTRRQLFVSALRVGRDHIAATVNTLFLAYAGASLPLLLLFVLSEQSLGSIANSEVVATEIVRTLVGSIGLVASVPLTTWLATMVVDAGGPGERAAPAPAP